MLRLVFINLSHIFLSKIGSSILENSKCMSSSRMMYSVLSFLNVYGEIAIFSRNTVQDVYEIIPIQIGYMKSNYSILFTSC